MTLEDRLERLANRKPPGDAADVMASARARAESRPDARSPSFLAAAAVVAVLALAAGGLALADGDDSDSVTVAGPEGNPERPRPSCEDIARFADSLDDTGIIYDYGASSSASSSPQDLAERSDVVFAGTLTGTVTDAADEESRLDYVGFEVQVTDRFKGEGELAGDTVTVLLAGRRSADYWAGPVPAGAPVLVFAQAPAGSSPRPGTSVMANPVEGIVAACEDGPPVGLVGGQGEWPSYRTLAEVETALDGRDGTATTTTVPELPLRPGSDCAGLRSETRWSAAGEAAEFLAPAGGTADYVETVTNGGTEACSIVHSCPPPGALYTTDGTPVPVNSVQCTTGIDYPSEDLAPGESRTQTWTAVLTAAPGDYILYVPQRDGAVAALPVALEEAVGACQPGTVELRPDPVYEQYITSGGGTRPQLQFNESDGRCTLRVARVELELRPADEPDAPAARFVDEHHRWYGSTPDAGVLVEPTFGPIDLPPAHYEGTIMVELDSGETFIRPSRLLIGQ